MPESRNHEGGGEQIIAIRFRMKASAEEVVAGLLKAARRTDLSLLKVFGDGNRLYPWGGGRNPARSASLWRAELFWRSPAINPGWQLEVFLGRAELFLELPGGVRLELGGGQRDPLEEQVRAAPGGF